MAFLGLPSGVQNGPLEKRAFHISGGLLDLVSELTWIQGERKGI